MIWRHSSGPGRCDLFTPRRCGNHPKKKKGAVGFHDRWGVLLSRTDEPEEHDLREQFCLKCGYDLRATPDRCPECGTIPPASKS